MIPKEVVIDPFDGVKSVHLMRCGTCPMHRIALRTTPARMNGFDSIKWVNNYFLWYNLRRRVECLYRLW